MLTSGFDFEFLKNLERKNDIVGGTFLNPTPRMLAKYLTLEGTLDNSLLSCIFNPQQSSIHGTMKLLPSQLIAPLL